MTLREVAVGFFVLTFELEDEMEWLVELLDKVPLEALIAVWGFAIVVNRLVAGGITPLFEKFNLDRFWLMYIAWGLAAFVIFTTNVNLFEAYIPLGWVGKILTALVVGGWANFKHDQSEKDKLVVGVSGFSEGAEIEIERDK